MLDFDKLVCVNDSALSFFLSFDCTVQDDSIKPSLLSVCILLTSMYGDICIYICSLSLFDYICLPNTQHFIPSLYLVKGIHLLLGVNFGHMLNI